MSRFVDEKGKIFGKINIIDFFVIIVVVLLIFGAVYKFTTMNKSVGSTGSASSQTVNYNVKVEKVRPVSLENVKEGDILFDKTSGNSIGKIIKVESEVAKDIVEMSDGSAVLGEVENRINLILTVEAEGIVNSKGTFVGKTYELLVGSKKKFFTKFFECEGSVSKIL